MSEVAKKNETLTKSPAKRLVPRSLRVDFSASSLVADRADPTTSAFLSAFSVVTPYVEKFVIETALGHARALGPDLEPGLSEEVRGLAAQETVHKRTHARLNREIFKKYPGLLRKSLAAKKGADRYLASLGPKERLALATVFEHVTTVMSRDLLGDRKRVLAMDPALGGLWIYHSLEELEHKTVLHDLSRAAGVSYLTLARQTLSHSFRFISFVLPLFLHVLRTEGGIGRGRRAAGALVAARALLRMLAGYAALLAPGFRPSGTDDTALIREWEGHLSRTGQLPPPRHPAL